MIKILKWASFALFLTALFVTNARAQSTYTAASCNQSDIQTAINSEQASPKDGDIISIPAGTCTWTGTAVISQTFHNSVTIQGQGAESVTSGGASTTGSDVSIITYNVSSGNPLFSLATVSGKSLRVTGIAFIQNSSSVDTYSGMLDISGASTSVRVDHCHFYAYTGGVSFRLDGGVTGVADHNFFDALSTLLFFHIGFYNGADWDGSTDGYGYQSWAEADYFGTSKFFFAEDDFFNNGTYVTDSSYGARYVVRHCTITDAQFENHGTNTAANRAGRAWEIYQNNGSVGSTTGGNWFSANAGTGLIWGNTVSGSHNLVGVDIVRKNNDTYEMSPLPNSWGYCGRTPMATGTASVAANSTAVTGSGFSTSWPSGSMFNLAGASCTVGAASHTGATCEISSVNSSTSITLSSASTVAVSGGAYTVGSPWDGNAQATGYPCLDQPGRGQGQLLSGTNFPNIVNSVTSTESWPNQVLDPIYAFDNTWTNPLYGGAMIIGTGCGGILNDNVDYYQQFGPNGESGTFNGTVGVGQGLYSAIPSSCTAGPGGNTPGVGYWATDQNTLYVCNPTNTWKAYYTPYTYPNPLTQADPPTPAAPTDAQAAGH